MSSDSADRAEGAGTLLIEEVGGPMMLCSNDGKTLALSQSAKELLRVFELPVEPLPLPVPQTLWEALSQSQVGAAIEWVPPSGEGLLGCTRYPVGQDRLLVLMREVSDKQRELSQRLHRQRLEAIGRLVATIAHDLRASLAPIVFNADVLSTQGDLPEEEVQESLSHIVAATDNLKRTIEGILDFARLGPPVTRTVALSELFRRVVGLLRGVLRRGEHSLTTSFAADAMWAVGNPILFEQVFVNLLTNAIEATDDGVAIQIRSTRRRESGRDHVIVGIEDNGPGVPHELRDRVFEPFFTTKQTGTGLGLTSSREAIREIGGDLRLVPSDRGASFEVWLPAASAPPRGSL